MLKHEKKHLKGDEFSSGTKKNRLKPVSVELTLLKLHFYL